MLILDSFLTYTLDGNGQLPALASRVCVDSRVGVDAPENKSLPLPEIVGRSVRGLVTKSY